MRTFAFIASLLFSVPALAALPPYYESTRILEAILENETLASRFGVDQTIQRIERDIDGYTVIGSSDCGVNVTVIYASMPPGFAGPTPFSLRIGPLFCYSH